MSRRTFTFELRSNRADLVVSALVKQVSETVRTAILFVSGSLSTAIAEIAQALALGAPRVNWLILPAAGILSDHGEIEAASAAAALFSDERLPIVLAPKADADFAERIGDLLNEYPGGSAFIALRADRNEDHGWLQALGEKCQSWGAKIFGGGLLPEVNLCSIQDGIIRLGLAACALIPATYSARFRASSACRLISPLRSVTRARGAVIHELEGMLALERLSEATAELTDQPLVLLAIAAGEIPLSKQGRSLSLRAIQGIDPGRGSLIMGEQIPIGARVAFAVRDSHAARGDLQAHLNSLKMASAGTAPEFGVFVSCAGRGRDLYGMDNVDLRMIKRSFPTMPLIGMHGTFEIAPMEGQLTPQIYTAVLGIFGRPS